jgi:hypothetical protein
MSQGVDRSGEPHGGAAGLKHEVTAIRLGAIFGFSKKKVHGSLDFGFLIPDLA